MSSDRVAINVSTSRRLSGTLILRLIVTLVILGWIIWYLGGLKDVGRVVAQVNPLIALMTIPTIRQTWMMKASMGVDRAQCSGLGSETKRWGNVLALCCHTRPEHGEEFVRGRRW